MPTPPAPAADQVHEDLRYVRRTLESSGRDSAPASIYLLWAAIGAVGFPLIDLAPERVPLFWAIASPAGLVASLWLGRRHARRAGQLAPREGWRHGLHWLALLVGAALTVPLALSGRIAGPALGQVILLLVTVVYFLAGIHLDRKMLAVSGLLTAGYLALFILQAWGWTVVGLTLAASLVACAVIAGGSGRDSAD